MNQNVENDTSEVTVVPKLHSIQSHLQDSAMEDDEKIASPEAERLLTAWYKKASFEFSGNHTVDRSSH